MKGEIFVFIYYGIIYGGILLSILVILYLVKYIFNQPLGNEKMQEISNAIKEGAMAFLKRQYKTIAVITSIVFVIIITATYLGNVSAGSDVALKKAVCTAAAFITGALCSALSGYIGMYITVNSNIRTAQGATKNLNEALKISFRGGAITGLAVTVLSLFGVTTLCKITFLL